MARDDRRRTPGFRPPTHDDRAGNRRGDLGDRAEARRRHLQGDHSDPATDGDDGRERDVHRRIVLEAAPEAVWRALTDPDELAAWWGEGSRLDAVPGGDGRLVEDGEPTRLVRVVEVRPGRRLVFDQWPEDPDVDEPASRVTIELVPCPFGTILTVVECTLLDLADLPVLVAPRPTFLPGPGRLHRPLGGRALARV